MDTKFILAALAGGVVLFLLGGLFYVLIFESFFMEAAGAGASVMRKEPLLWAIFIGELINAGLLTLIFSRWASISTLAGGAKAGAIIGLLFGLSINLVFYGTTTMGTLTSGVVDALITLVRFGIAGGVIGWVLGRK